MAMDHAKQRALQQAAEALLKEHYDDGRAPDLPLDPMRVMQDVRLAANGELTRNLGTEPPEVPAEHPLAALTQIDEARQRVDRLELDLIRAARARGASWQKIAEHLGLATRQSAETRALRLERAVTHYNRRGRGVAGQRIEKARQRIADAWCVEHEDRIREVCERLYDAAEAWSELRSPLAASYMHTLAATLASGGSGAQLVDCLESLRLTLAPYGNEQPKPTGKQAAEATAAREAMLALLDELWDTRMAVASAREARS